MGYIKHDAVLAVVADYHPQTIEQIEAFRDSLPDEMRPFLVGPVVGTNGYHAYAFLPDGSKEGWTTSDDFEEQRRAFVQVCLGFRHGDGSGPADVVSVSFGGDFGWESGATVRDESASILKEARDGAASQGDEE